MKSKPLKKFRLEWTETQRCSSIVYARTKKEAIDLIDSDESLDSYEPEETLKTYEEITVEEL